MTTPVWAGPFLVALLLLGAASVLKLVHPAQTAGALGAVGLPRSTVLVRAGAASELAVTGAAIGGSRLGAALVAVSYLGFASFVVVALRRRLPVGSCGCFGGVDTPPSLVHVVVDAGAAISAGAAASARSMQAVPSMLNSQPWHGVPFGLLVVATAGLAFIVLTDLARVLVSLGPRSRA